MHMPLLRSSEPSLAAKIIAPVGRFVASIQKTVAGILGFKSANGLAVTTTAVGAGAYLLSPVFGPFAPVVSTLGATVAGAGALDWVGNKAAEKAAKMDGKGRA